MYPRFVKLVRVVLPGMAEGRETKRAEMNVSERERGGGRKEGSKKGLIAPAEISPILRGRQGLPLARE